VVPWAVIALSGEIDPVTAPVVLEAILVPGDSAGLAVDFSSVDFVGVAAVDVLAKARRRLRSETGEGT
jgi:anti-anti-sigma regulatory factor